MSSPTRRPLNLLFYVLSCLFNFTISGQKFFQITFQLQMSRLTASKWVSCMKTEDKQRVEGVVLDKNVSRVSRKKHSVSIQILEMALVKQSLPSLIVRSSTPSKNKAPIRGRAQYPIPIIEQGGILNKNSSDHQ